MVDGFASVHYSGMGMRALACISVDALLEVNAVEGSSVRERSAGEYSDLMMRPGAALSWEMLTLKLRNPFRVSYGTSETRNAFWIRLAGDEGWGEGTIPPYYRVDPSAITDCWKRAAEQKRPLPETIDGIADWIPDGP